MGTSGRVLERTWTAEKKKTHTHPLPRSLALLSLCWVSLPSCCYNPQTQLPVPTLLFPFLVSAMTKYLSFPEALIRPLSCQNREKTASCLPPPPPPRPQHKKQPFCATQSPEVGSSDGKERAHISPPSQLLLAPVPRHMIPLEEDNAKRPSPHHHRIGE